MKTLLSQLERAFSEAIRNAFGFEAEPQVTISQHENFGDYQSNAAMNLVRRISQETGQKTNPRAVADKVVANLDLGGMAQEVSIAGPGFVNVRLAPAWLGAQLNSISGDERAGAGTVSEPQTVVLDYSCPNIAKQMHVGHLRSTIIGDALSRVLEFQGHSVIRQNHIGDWGTQFGMLITYLKSLGLQEETHIADLEEFYRQAKERFDADPSFQDEARRCVVRLQGGEPAERELWQRIVDESRLHFQPLYERLGVRLRPDHERGESFYNPLLPGTVRELREKGIAVESEGAIAIFCEGYEAPLIIEKSGGGYLYSTTDLAAIQYRVRELGAQRIIYVHDSRQTQHFSQVFGTARKAGWAEGVSLEYAPFGTLLGPDGKPFKTRTGGTVRLKDLLDEAEERAFALVTEKNPLLPDGQRRQIARAAGIGAIKYGDLSKDRVNDYVFSWEKMLALDGNTAPYMQYAYARVRSIFRKAGIAQFTPGPVILETPFEAALARQILRLGEIIELVARELKPHYMCIYLYELAARYSSFYENCPVLLSEEPLRTSRLTLCDLTARTLAVGLDLLGIEHPEQM